MTKGKIRILSSAFLLITLHTGELPAFQQDIERRVYYAERINPSIPVIDGILDDEIWVTGRWGSEFIQREPYEGVEPSEETEFIIKYDDKNLYVAFRMYDTAPGEIDRRLTRRDEIEGGRVAIILDTFNDHRTAFAFAISTAGVKIDGVFSNDSGDMPDLNWDPVWYAGINLDETGWTAEMRIPFSQLRFADADEQLWGMQVERFLYRREEVSSWQHIPRQSSGWVSRFGELRGISGIGASRRIELLPYSSGKLETSLAEADNPFADGRDWSMLGGLDGKIGVTGNLTLDLAVNPDFGQVEADPSVVNLTAFETFFPEKRPFFIEGKNILDYQVTGGNGDFSQDNLFYSRRIGRRPQHSPDTDDDENVNVPDQTNIASAMKLTGKTQGGLSVGVLNAVTVRERAEIDKNGTRRHETAEPLTNYFIGRLQKDFRRGDTRIGGMMTATNRNINAEHLAFLNRAAYSGGIDFVHNWNDKTYYFDTKLLFSNIRGDREAILDAQTSSVRYYQRPDAGYVKVDSSAKSLSGHGGTITVGKGGNGHWRYSLGTTWRSPGLELNDAGFLREADNIMEVVWAQYYETDPKWIFRNFSINGNQWHGWNFGGENIFDGGNINGSMQLKNYWRFGFGINRNGESLSPSMLRGGPAFRNPGGWSTWIWSNSDSRKRFQFNVNGNIFRSDNSITRNHSVTTGFIWRPVHSLQLQTSLDYGKNINNLQYVETAETDAGDRYIFGRIDQKTAGVTIRANYSITPDLTIQYYGQPFISAGTFTHLSRITDPRAHDYFDRYREYTAEEIAYSPEDEEYVVDEPGAGSYTFDDPDFNFRQLRSNLVLRWEYTPGSILYLVWAQSRTGDESTGRFAFGSDMNRLFDIYPDNVFLIKFNRWLSF
ncbi:DUF5916 domain-containing protein [candidate division KSB1 bacterium]